MSPGGKQRGTRNVFATEVDDEVKPPLELKPKKIKKTRKTPIPTDDVRKTPTTQTEATKYEGTCGSISISAGA